MSSEQQPPLPAANDEQNALAALKTLLRGEEQTSIKRLQEETRNPQIQSQRVAESLPESIDQAYRTAPHQLTRSLESPVSECIEGSVQRNPGLFADILYPVMGPAIRRSIAQALKGLVQQINQTLEHSLTAKGLKWRFEALRTGVPFPEIVLRNTLLYRVEEAFLIQSGSGLLIQHLSQTAAPARDADAVSAMLTAIRDFTQDAMNRDDKESKLETIDVGDHTLWLVHGSKAYLACAIRGMPPVGLRDRIADVLGDIHQRYSELLESFDGDPAAAAPLAALMEPCLQSAVAEPGRKRFPWPLVLILLALAGLIGWWSYQQWQAGERAAQREHLLSSAAERLAAAPGVVLTDWQIHDDLLQLRGLHDPLTPAPDTLLAAAGLNADDYRLAFERYQSSDHAAARARAQQRLAPPSSVRLTLDQGGTLSASGHADNDWSQRAALLATTIPGVEHYDDSGLEDADRRLHRLLDDRLQPPERVDIRVESGRARLSGEAPLAWIRSLPAQPPAIDGLQRWDTADLLPLERHRLAELMETIESTRIDFVSGIELGDEQYAQIRTLAGLIHEAYALSKDLGRPIRLAIIGRTDGTGTPDQNLFVARQRAERVSMALLDAQPVMPDLELRALTRPTGDPDTDVRLRRVEFQVLDRNPPAQTAR